MMRFEGASHTHKHSQTHMMHARVIFYLPEIKVCLACRRFGAYSIQMHASCIVYTESCARRSIEIYGVYGNNLKNIHKKSV